MTSKFKFAKLLAVCGLSAYFMQSAFALSPVNESALRNAWSLFTQKKYAASADAFEALIRTSTPNARLYYYAAAANRNSNRIARAKQLADYVVVNFPASAEAAQAKQMFPAAAASGLPANLPEQFKNKSIEELMETEEGRKALKEALAKPAATSSSNASGKSAKSAGTPAITATDIAADGASGITELSAYSDGSFESSLAALATMSRGQKVLASMIHPTGDPDTYTVRFPGDTQEYRLTPQAIEACRVRDKALWSTLIRCAATMKARSNSTGNLEEGLAWLTGKKAEKIHCTGTTEQSLAAFIAEAVKTQSPIICLAKSDCGTFPELVEMGLAYTITGFDPSSGMITLRNPNGANSRRFRLKPENPDYKKFEQLNDGMCKLNVALFSRYFEEIARAPL